ANLKITVGHGIGDSVHVQNINVRANAFDANGAGLTLANAQLLLSASIGEFGGIHMHNVHVNATAHEAAGTANAKAHAIGNAFINAVNNVIGSGNDVFVYANAVDGSSANAIATLHVTAGHVALGTEDNGRVGAQAQAKAIQNNDQAHAWANVDIVASQGNASIFGVLE